jgi:hypothetical protein
MPWNGLPPGLLKPPSSLPADETPVLREHGWMGTAPGTVVLVFVFLLAFMTYYFVNWKMLSFIWKIG